MVLALGTGWALTKVGLVLAALLGGLVLANRRVRSRVEASGTRKLPLTAQHSLHVVEIDGRRLLVGVGPSGAPRLLCDLDPESSEGASPSADASTRSSQGPRVGWDGF